MWNWFASLTVTSCHHPFRWDLFQSSCSSDLLHCNLSWFPRRCKAAVIPERVIPDEAREVIRMNTGVFSGRRILHNSWRRCWIWLHTGHNSHPLPHSFYIQWRVSFPIESIDSPLQIRCAWVELAQEITETYCDLNGEGSGTFVVVFSASNWKTPKSGPNFSEN